MLVTIDDKYAYMSDVVRDKMVNSKMDGKIYDAFLLIKVSPNGEIMWVIESGNNVKNPMIERYLSIYKSFYDTERIDNGRLLNRLLSDTNCKCLLAMSNFEGIKYIYALYESEIIDLCNYEPILLLPIFIEKLYVIYTVSI